MKKKILSIIALVLIFTLSFGQVALAADITVSSDNAGAYEHFENMEAGIFWTSNSTGYMFHKYYQYMRKTTNGGSTWSNVGSAQNLDKAASCWADWETPGDTGTKMHFAYHYGDAIYYKYFDTYTDTWSAGVLVESTITHCAGPNELSELGISITKTAGKTLAISAFVYYTIPGPIYENIFEISEDGGNTWIAKTSPLESDRYDLDKLMPGNESDQNDLYQLFWDYSESEISIKKYDYSADSWSETSISTGMYGNYVYYTQWDAKIRPYDNHIIFGAWDTFDSASANLTVWNIENGGNTITELTPVTENSSESFQVAITIDPSNNDIYVSYLTGGTIETSANVVYQKSTDGGLSWSGEISFSDSTKDYRQVWTTNINPQFGGKFMPLFFEHEVVHYYYYTNYIHSITISNYQYSSDPALAPEYIIDCPECTDNLTSSGNFTSNETFSGGPPGFAVIDDAAGESGAAPIWLWGWVGMFAIIVPGFFVTYMERKHGAGNGNLILRMGIALIVMGLLVTWGRFDWWMVVLYLFIAAAPAFMSRQYDVGGAGGVSQHGWIGFCATSWIGLTIINRILEGQFLTASESSWWCSIQLFNEFRVFDLFTVPVLNFQFFTVGIPSLLRWDYSFFGGNAELIQYFLYTITAVVAFILFCILIGLLFNAFRAR